MLARVVRLIAMAVFALAGIAPGSAHAQSGPIKIGLLVPLTGAASALGKDMLAGTELYLDEINRQVAGRKIELIVEDTEGVTATALTKARKLVDQDHVAILTGGLLASTGYALHPFADAAKIPTTYPVMSSDDLTQRKPAKWVVRTGWNSSQSMQRLRRVGRQESQVQEGRHGGLRLRLRLGNGGRASSAPSRSRAGRSSRRSGRRSTPPTSRRSSPRSSPTPTPSSPSSSDGDRCSS